MKYKIGDKVRVIYRKNEKDTAWYGDEGTIFRLHDNGNFDIRITKKVGLITGRI